MITLEEILGNNTDAPDDIMENIQTRLLPAINEFRQTYGIPMIVSSGYRTLEYNASIGGAPNSNHCLGLAVDILDQDSSLDLWCFDEDNHEVLANIGLYIEHPYYTKGWTHFQVVPPKSGNMFFIPYSGSIKNPDTSFEKP